MDSIRKNMIKRLDSLEYTFANFTLTDFKEWVEKRLDRTIKMVAWEAMPPGMYAMWVTWAVSRQRVEIIFYDSHLPTVHRVHTLLHELAHIICGHQTLCLDKEKLSYLMIYPDRLSELLLQAGRFRSTRYNDQTEVEAETIALLIYERAIRRAGLSGLAVVPNDEISTYVRAMGLD